MKTFTEKNSLKDNLDVLIPFYMDHHDRTANAHKVIDYLQSCGVNNIYIKEYYDARSPEYSLAIKIGKNFIPEYVENLENFNKMRCVNELADITKSKYLAIWDVDVIFPRSAIDKSLELLENGVDVVYPYNGNFYNIPKEQFSMLENGKIDLDKCELWNENSYGGCVMFKREVFVAGGKCNPNFRNVGVDDNEIHARFYRLGYRIARTDNPLFHLDHYRSETSVEKNPHFNYNMQIYNKICSMSREEILEEINKWK